MFESTKVAPVCEAGHLTGVSITKDKPRVSRGMHIRLELLICNCVQGHHQKIGKDRKAMEQTLLEAHAEKIPKQKDYNKRTLNAGLRETSAPQGASVSPGPKVALINPKQISKASLIQQ